MARATDRSGRVWIHDECGSEHHPGDDCPIGEIPDDTTLLRAALKALDGRRHPELVANLRRRLG